MTKIFIIIEDGANPGEIRYQQFSDVELNPRPRETNCGRKYREQHYIFHERVE